MDTVAIDPQAGVGHVRLTVRDLPRMRHFYEDILGFREAWSAGGTVFLSADGLYPFHLGFTVEPPGGVPARGQAGAERTSPGLYHAAFLLPTRRALALLLQRLIARGVAFDGFSDHLVSEAVYLHDPEGNGIELYADRPRELWSYDKGEVLMSTAPLDIEGLFRTAGGGPPLAGRPGEALPVGGRQAGGAGGGVDPGTRLGHVHLRVSSTERAEAFYHGTLGFDVTVRGYPGALFFSAGGYHHHLGTNTWESLGAPPAPQGSPGLRYFTVTLPGKEAFDRVVRRAAARGARIEGATDHGLYTAVALRDEDGIGVTLTVDSTPGRVPAAGWHSEPRDMNAVLQSA